MRENPIPKRLKEARQRKGITQEALGVQAGIDEFTASARMNQYEKGKHLPSYELLTRCGSILDVPVEFFYTVSDDTAEMLLFFHQLSTSQRTELLNNLKGYPCKESTKKDA